MADVEIATLVHDMLHNLGYKAEMVADDAVGSAASGFKFYIQSYDDSIQFRCLIGVEGGGRDWLEFANDFNKQIRFTKIYVDDEESLVAETDWRFDPSDIDRENSFRQSVDFWELSLSLLKEKLREKASRLVTQDADTEE
jgi:hypothetical protein